MLMGFHQQSISQYGKYALGKEMPRFYLRTHQQKARQPIGEFVGQSSVLLKPTPKLGSVQFWDNEVKVRY